MKKLWQALMWVRRADAAAFRRRLFYVLLQSLLPVAALYLLKMLVDGITQAVAGGGADRVLPSLLAMVAVFLMGRVVAALNSINNDILSQRLIDYMSDLMQQQAASLDLSYYDTPEYHDTLHRAQQEVSSRPVAILANFMALFSALITLLGIAAVLVTASWWVIVVMFVAVVPSLAVRLYKAQSIYRFRRRNTQLYRRTAYYGSLLTSRQAAAEMRTFRLAPWFRRLFVSSRRQLVSRLFSISRRLGAADICCALIEAAAMLLVLFLLVRQALGAAISLGSFVMLLEAFRRGQAQLNTLAASIAGLYDNRLFVSNVFEFLALKPAVLPPDDPQPMPPQIVSVEFRDVTFRYPGMHRDVLSHFCLQAKVGEVVRIEGRNGFGKSTLVKLLLRLYDPAEGSVLLNGIDIRRFRLDDLRRRIGVLFQDFVRYNCSAAENITFGDIDHPDHSLRHAAALAGADSVIDHLPQGDATLLGRLFDQGAELSMGQWQRMAIARALQSDAPLLILDEPFAWLDADARRLLNQNLSELQKNKIIILITHS